MMLTTLRYPRLEKANGVEILLYSGLEETFLRHVNIPKLGFTRRFLLLDDADYSDRHICTRPGRIDFFPFVSEVISSALVILTFIFEQN